MSEPDVLVVGETLVDVVRDADGGVRRHPGGSAANAALALARLGRSVGLLTCLGRDDAGEQLAAHLAGSGVALVGDPWVLDRTSSATATLDPEGAASYAFDITWAPQDVECRGVRAVHVGSIGAVLLPGATVVRDIVTRLDDGVVLSYDVNARTAVTGSGPEVLAAVEHLAGRADLVKVSDEDLMALWPALGPERTVDRLLALGSAAVVLTRGAAGATWHDAGGRVETPAEPVRVVDTIAAGDTFAAALLDGLLDLGMPWQGAALEEAMRRASLAAAITVSRPGADPPSAAELASGA